MVWHAYQLNPRDFLEDCLRYGKIKFWASGFPWAAVDPCIDNVTMDFAASSNAIDTFVSKTGCAWNNLDDSPMVMLDCPMCRAKLSVPWTRWDSLNAWTGTPSSSILTEKASATGSAQSPGNLHVRPISGGFADMDFEQRCNCGVILDHDLLRILKFRKDMEALRFRDMPMPGTLLDMKGMLPVSLQKNESKS